MKNKKGFTVVELIVSFGLTLTIAFFLMQIILILKDMYLANEVKAELLNKQALINDKIYDDFRNKDIDSVTSCGEQCIVFLFTDQTTSTLSIDQNNKVFHYGDYTTKIVSGSQFGEMEVLTHVSSNVEATRNNAFLEVHVPITNSLVPGDFGLNVIYQYNSRLKDIAYSDVSAIELDLGELQNLDDWSKVYPERFKITQDSSIGLSRIDFTGSDMHEKLYFKMETEVGKSYTISFDFYNPNGYHPLPGSNGIAYQVSSNMTNDNTGSNLVRQHLPTSSDTNTNTYSLTFTAASTTTYFAFNFGYVEDGEQTVVYLGNVKISMNSTNEIPYIATSRAKMSGYSAIETDTTQASTAHYVLKWNHYSTDGLLARYDGEYNVNGLHSTGSNWTELYTGTSSPVTNGTWGSNYLELNGTSTWANLGSMDTEYQTMEITFSTPELPSGYQIAIGNIDSGGGEVFIGPNQAILGNYVINESATWLTANNKLEANKKYHVVLTYDGKEEILYINGVKEQSSLVSGRISYRTPSTVMALGTNPSGNNANGEFFKGKIYNAAVYNRALTKEEVMEHYLLSTLE